MEEQGLLGSQYFAQHPLWPLSHIVAGVNLDANMPEGRAHDMVIVGSGASELEDMLAERAEDAEPHDHARSGTGEGLFKKILIANRGEIACRSSRPPGAWGRRRGLFRGRPRRAACRDGRRGVRDRAAARRRSPIS
jgi:hypothetical protein